jgi:predicted GH43/DUF377 family glycosyl hydrolase
MIATSYLNCSGTLISAAMGISDANVRHFDRMMALLHKGSELARQAKMSDILADALCRRAGDETERNPEFGRYDLIDEAIQLRRKRRDAEGVRDALRDKARIGMRTGRLDVTEQSLMEADKIQRRLKQPDPQWTNIHGHQYWGECFALQERWPEAVEKLSLALKGARRFGHQGGITAATGWLGLAWCHLGELDKGVQLIRSAMARERDILQSQEGVGKWLIEIGRFLDGNGETERALHALWLAEIIYEDLQHTALRRTKEILVKIADRVPERYAALRTVFNPFTVEFAPYCSLWGLPPLRQSPHNPVLQPQGDLWESRAVFNPSAWSDGTTLHLLYQAKGNLEHPVIGHASSNDGCNFERVSEQPLLAPSEPWELSGGYADPRLVFIEEENAFYLTYSIFRDGIARLALARSIDPNLRSWEKLGLIFSMDQWHGAFPHDLYPEIPIGWSRSGAIYPKRINGLFWMYFGDSHIWAACSHDLRSWDIVPKPILSPRPGHFDAVKIAPGPPPVLLAEGLLLVYNGARLDETGQLVYTIGQALFDSTSPTRVLRRSYNPLLQSEAGNTVHPHAIFAEGLTIFKESWLLFYGIEEREIGVATNDINRVN